MSVSREFQRPHLFEETASVMMPRTRALALGETAHINTSAGIIAKQSHLDTLGIAGHAVALIDAGGKNFSLVDVSRDRTFAVDFALMEDGYDPGDPDSKGCLGIPYDTTVTIGRQHHEDEFNYPDTTSGHHFTVIHDSAGLRVQNLRPTNHTTLTTMEAGAPAPPMLHNISANRTHEVKVRARDLPGYGEPDTQAPYGYYLDHPILGRDSKHISNGVYMGGSAREAIVVDARSRVLRGTYAALEQRLVDLRRDRATVLLEDVLQRVNHQVQAIMQYDMHRTETLSEQYHGDKLISLSTYVREGVGVCRHQGLLAAYILEKLVDSRVIGGQPAVERNTIRELGGTHAWATFTAGAQKYVIDPAQNFVGTKEQAREQGRWEYALTNDDLEY